MATLAEVEQAITQLEAEGAPVNANRVWHWIGGRRHTIQTLFKAARKPPARVSPVQAQLSDARALQQALLARLGTLSTKDSTLTATQVNEQLICERQLQNLTPIIERLQQEVAQAQQRADIAGMLQLWGPLVQRKIEAYADFLEALQEVRKCFAIVLELHREQAGLVEDTLPREAQAQLSFPDPTTMGQRIVGRLPRGSTNLEVLLLLPESLHGLDLAAILDVDPGTRPLPERLLAPYTLEE